MKFQLYLNCCRGIEVCNSKNLKSMPSFSKKENEKVEGEKESQKSKYKTQKFENFIDSLFKTQKIQF